MKTTLKKILGLATLGMALLTNTAPSWAGAQYPVEVAIIYDDSTYAMGSMVGARYSTDNTQYIGCFTNGQGSLSSPSIRCFARDRVGNTAFCISLDLRFVPQIQAMTDSSYISFVANRSNALCDSLRISNNSSQLK